MHCENPSCGRPLGQRNQTALCWRCNDAYQKFAGRHPGTDRQAWIAHSHRNRCKNCPECGQPLARFSRSGYCRDCWEAFRGWRKKRPERATVAPEAFFAQRRQRVEKEPADVAIDLEQLLEERRQQIYRIASRIRHPRRLFYSLDDLAAFGRLGVLRAVRHCKDFSCAAYFEPWIRGAILSRLNQETPLELARTGPPDGERRFLPIDRDDPEREERTLREAFLSRETPETILLRRERERAVWQATAALGEPARSILYWVFYQDHSRREVRASLGISPQRERRLYREALDALRQSPVLRCLR